MVAGFFLRLRSEIEHWLRSSWSLRAVEVHYDDLAADYDAINQRVDSYFRRFTDTIRLAELPDDAYILDIFARTGKGIAYFQAQGKVGRAVCVDVSTEMGRLCSRRLYEIGFHNFRWIQICAYGLPLPDNEFDVILSLETVEHFDDPQRIIKEMGRVTRPGGTLLLTTPNTLWEPIHALASVTGVHHSEGPHRFIPVSRLRQYISRAGFEIMKYQTYVIIPAGPTWLLKVGQYLEQRMSNRQRSAFGLRRVFVCRKLP